MSKNDTVNKVYMSIRNVLARSVSRLVPPHEIEDIVQETYVRVCQVKNPEQITHPRSFLLKTARNLALDHLKRAETRLSVQLEDDFESVLLAPKEARDEVLQKVESDQEFALFCEAVRHLPVQCKRAFVLKKVYGYTQKEIAANLVISESTVEKHIATGMKRCVLFIQARRNEPNESVKTETAHMRP